LHGRHSAPLLPGASFFSAGASTPSADDLADNLALRRADPAVQVDQNADDPKGDEAEQETAEQTVVVWREQTDPLSETVAADAEEEEEERSKRAASSWFVGSERLSGIWLIRPTARERLRDWVSEWAPFSLREQGWWRGLWRRSLTRVGMIAALACVVGLVGVIAFYVSLGSRAAANNLPSISSPTPGQSSLIISSATNITGATPTVPDYEIGVWSSDDMPLGGQVTIFARVTHHYAGVAGVKVSFSVQFPNGSLARYGPVKTDKVGLASVLVGFGGVGAGQIIFVTATVTVGGQSISADTSFTPA